MKKGERRGGRAGFLLSVIPIFLAIALFTKGGILQSLFGMDVSFLLLPTLIPATVNFMSHILKSFFTGRLLSSLQSGLGNLCLGLFLFIILVGETSAAYFVLFLTLLAAAYPVVKYTLRMRPMLQVTARTLALLLAGIGGYLFFASVADTMSEFLMWMVLVGAIFAVGFSLLSFLFFHPSDRVSFAGRVFDHAVPFAFFLGFFLAYLFGPARTYLWSRYGGGMALVEWGGFCFLFGVSSMVLVRGLRRWTKPVKAGEWTKHLPLIEVTRDKSVEAVAGYVKEFVERGSKGKLLVHLVRSVEKEGVPEERILAVVRELVDYHPPQLPRLAFRSELRELERREQAKRREIVERVIRKLREL